MRVITVAGLKGGLGKTTTAVHLAAWWARSGSTMLVDADPQMSAISWTERCDPPPPFATAGLPVRDLRRQLPALAAGRDTVIIDTGPGREHRQILVGALLCSDLAIVPLAPSYMEHDRLAATQEVLEEVQAVRPGLRWRLLLARVRAGTVSAAGAVAALDELGLPLLASRVPLHERYMAAFGTPLAGDLGAYEGVGEETELLLDHQEVPE